MRSVNLHSKGQKNRHHSLIRVNLTDLCWRIGPGTGSASDLIRLFIYLAPGTRDSFSLALKNILVSKHTKSILLVTSASHIRAFLTAIGALDGPDRTDLAALMDEYCRLTYAVPPSDPDRLLDRAKVVSKILTLSGHKNAILADETDPTRLSSTVLRRRRRFVPCQPGSPGPGRVDAIDLGLSVVSSDIISS
jgi:hypothetical protein